MKLDRELVFKVLSVLEEQITVEHAEGRGYTKTEILLDSFCENPILTKDYRSEDIFYTLSVLERERYIACNMPLKSDTHTAQIFILDLTWVGHNLLNSMRKEHAIE